MASIVFDLDGTLIDSAPDIHAVTNACLADEGLPALSLPVVRGFIGNGVSVLLARALAALGRAEDAALHARLLAAFEPRYEAAQGLTVLYPGVLEALDALLDQGHALGLCTNKPLGATRAALAHFGLDTRLAAVIGGDSLPQRKPDPAPLNAAFAALPDALPTGAQLYVGDSETDAETARRAGIRFLLFTEGYRKTPVEELPQAGRFDAFAALPALVADQLAGQLSGQPARG